MHTTLPNTVLSQDASWAGYQVGSGVLWTCFKQVSHQLQTRIWSQLSLVLLLLINLSEWFVPLGIFTALTGGESSFYWQKGCPCIIRIILVIPCKPLIWQILRKQTPSKTRAEGSIQTVTWYHWWYSMSTMPWRQNTPHVTSSGTKVLLHVSPTSFLSQSSPSLQSGNLESEICICPGRNDDSVRLFIIGSSKGHNPPLTRVWFYLEQLLCHILTAFLYRAQRSAGGFMRWQWAAWLTVHEYLSVTWCQDINCIPVPAAFCNEVLVSGFLGKDLTCLQSIDAVWMNFLPYKAKLADRLFRHFFPMQTLFTLTAWQSRSAALQTC